MPTATSTGSFSRSIRCSSAIPSDLSQIYVAGPGNIQVPLSSVARIEKTLAPLVINHQGQFPAVTITYNLAPDVPIETASAAIEQAVASSCTCRRRCAPSLPAMRRCFGARSARSRW